jgi:Na+:H+ antiporter, NhaA family
MIGVQVLSSRSWMAHPALPGVLLVIMAVLAMLASNSRVAPYYDALLATPVSVQAGSYALRKPLLLWINDGLMAIFFFVVGLEIKKELLAGALASVRQAMLPLMAAIGGMMVPAMIYALCTLGDAQAARGWAIPAATDIAFAMGVLALLGNRVPAGLKIFLLALAIIDDLGAIIVIAIFYTSDLSTGSLAMAAVGLLGLFALNRRGVARTAPYVLIGVFTWVCVLKSGVHATLAGVAVAFAIPLVDRRAGQEASQYADGPVERLKHNLEPWVNFGVLPIFAFANAGVAVTNVGVSTLLSPIPLGIALGLFVGKQAGVFGASWLAVRLGWARLPEGVSWRAIHGAAVLAGIGFTMSLFVGSLAFNDVTQAAHVRLGVIAGSLASAVFGYVLLRSSLIMRAGDGPSLKA